MTFRDVLGRDNRGRIPWHDHDASDISGDGVFLDLKVDRLVGGTITGEEFIIGGGVDGIIRSDNFVAGSDGWIFRGDGSGEINDLIVRGDIESGNWDGASPANLTTADTGATAGFYHDSSVGSAQLMGNLFVGGDIELFDGDGIFRSAASDEPRVEIGFTDFATTTTSQIDFYTTDDIEGGSPGSVYKAVSIKGGELDGLPSLALLEFEFFTDASVLLRTAKFGLRSTPAFDNPALHLLNAAGTDFAGEVVANYILSGNDGTAAFPVFGWWDELDLGLFRVSVNVMGITTGGVERVRIGNTQMTFAAAVTGAASIKTSAAGTVALPAYVFSGDTGLGAYRPSVNQYALAVAGVQEFFLTPTIIRIPNVYNTTTGSAANVFVDSTGRLFRDNSSAARYKTNIVPFSGAGVLDLIPKEYDYQPEELGTIKNGGAKKKRPTKVGDPQHTVGFILEDVAEVYPVAVSYNADGEPDGLNWKAITTGLLAEVKNMRDRIDVLEAAA